jgi:excinuclease ABC subunit B
LERSERIAEQLIRPTGIVDPVVSVRPTEGQIDDLLERIRGRVDRGERVLVTTMTKRMAEDLADYLRELGVKVQYLHSEVDTLERVQILRDLRLGVFDVLVGINLLREGIDLPEVTLVAILDADKEGFLRSESSLIQTSGRAARNVNGLVIMYGDTVTRSMQRCLDACAYRRTKQEAYNAEHGITPTSIVKNIDDLLSSVYERDYMAVPAVREDKPYRTLAERAALVADLQRRMKAAAANLDFEEAARLRDRVRELRVADLGLSPVPAEPGA